MKIYNANKIEIICDGNDVLGFGHIKRSSSLKECLEQKGFLVNLRVISKDDLNSQNNKSLLRIVDLPYPKDDLINEANKINIPCIALDYFGNAEPDLTISIYEHNFPQPKGKRVSGLEYAIIRDSIKRADKEKQNKTALVMIGGADINQSGDSIALKIASHETNVNLVRGPFNKSSSNLKNRFISIYKNPSNIDNLMSSSIWGVTNGGGSMMEMMSLGKAVYVVPQTKEEETIANYIYKHDGILGVGIESISVPSEEIITRVGKKAASMIDGNGLHRILEHVIEIIEKHYK